MLQIRKRLFIVLLILLFPLQGIPQSGILSRKDLLVKVRGVLSSMYNYDFDQAKTKLDKIKSEIPDHPAVTFLEALVMYWEDYPLTLESKNTNDFLRLMEETIQKAESLNQKDPDNLESIFFSLFGKAFYVMFWADNGKPGKVFPYLNSMYHYTIKGMEIKDKFTEFYFSTGLYNFYIEAYPEKHPIYRPISRLFKHGNREEGLKDLQYCAENATYLRVEAKYFLSLLYLGYEDNPKKASEFAADLYREFPKNIGYMGNYAYTLLFDKKFSVAEIIIQNLAQNSDQFSQLQAHIFNGYLLEKYKNDFAFATKEYEEGLKLAGKFGENVNSFKAMAWMGLGRQYKREGDINEASKYFKWAKNISSYDYLIDDK